MKTNKMFAQALYNAAVTTNVIIVAVPEGFTLPKGSYDPAAGAISTERRFKVELLPNPPVPPAGFRLVTLTSDYYGSHYEYGEGDTEETLAVPEGWEGGSELSTSHGHYSSGPVTPPPPDGTLSWSGWKWDAWGAESNREKLRKNLAWEVKRLRENISDTERWSPGTISDDLIDKIKKMVDQLKKLGRSDLDLSANVTKAEGNVDNPDESHNSSYWKQELEFLLFRIELEKELFGLSE